MAFEVKDIFQAVWGFVPVYSVPELPSVSDVFPAKYRVPKKEEPYSGVTYQVPVKTSGDSDSFYADGDKSQSWMGLDVMFPFWLGGENLRYFNENTGELKYEKTEKILIPAATLVDFSRQKEIITTKMSAGYGTVKELYSFGDWDIKIRGVLFDERKDERTAVELRRRLLAFEKYADSIPVSGWLFNETHNINRIVIHSIQLRQLQGKPWVIPFEMNCSSDQNLELILN
ncbi:MAG: DUF6046 domain-containing protein [Chitinophagales bacterium]|nr:DUF6046 domain-containing protein [Chitinophagales bacterium]